jgi:hypothetical protein
MDTFNNLLPIKWELTNDVNLASKTRAELMEEIGETRHEFWKAKIVVERAAIAVDATNAQLALGGMYASKSQVQLLAREEAEKSKDEGGRIKGTFGCVVTHNSFLRDQAEHAQWRSDEGELERLKEEARDQWKQFNEMQKGKVVRWHKEKAHLVALKQKVPPKPSEILMRDWMADNYPQLQQSKPPETSEAPGDTEQVVEGFSASV